MLNAGAQLRQHCVGDVGGQLGAEEHPDPFGANQLHGLLDLLQKGLGRVSKQQVRLIEEEHQLGLVDIADLRQIGEQISQHPHQERREHHRTGGLFADFEERDDAASLVIDAEQIGRFDLGFPEERVAALGLKVDQRAQDHTGGRRRHPADRFQLFFALVAGEVGDHRTKVLEVQQRQTLLIGPVEDQSQGGFLSRIEPQHFR